MKKYFMMLAVVALTASCTRTEVVNNSVNAEDVLIQAKPVHELVSGAVTRIPFTGNISGTNHLVARVLTYDNENAAYADGNMIFSATNAAQAYDLPMISGSHKFEGEGTSTFTMFGLYPATDWNREGTGLTEHTYSTVFDGTKDVMITETVTTTPEGSAAGTYPTLIFKHQLTKLEIKVRALDAAAEAVWKKFESITLTKLHGASEFNTSLTYQPVNGGITFGTPASTMSFYEIDNTQSAAPAYTADKFTGKAVDIELANSTGSNIVPVAYSMIAPFISKGNEDLTVKIEAVYDDGEQQITVSRDVNISIPANFTSGYAYSITLTFADTGMILATAEVIDWLDGGELEEVIM